MHCNSASQSVILSRMKDERKTKAQLIKELEQLRKKASGQGGERLLTVWVPS